jgi:methionyl-tRNA synthetase
MSNRKAAAKKKSAQNPTKEQAGEVDGPKSAEALVLEEKFTEQGGLVRELKARTPKTKGLEEETAAAIAELKKLKAEHAALSK